MFFSFRRTCRQHPKMENEIQYVSPRTHVYKFPDMILDKTIVYQAIKMDGSVLIYINDLEIAMNLRFSSIPSTTSLLGPSAEHPGSNVANRLSKKLNKTLFLSLNLEDPKRIILLAEKRLVQEINRFPDKF